MNNVSMLGTELKINVHIEPVDGISMSQYEFECHFYAYSRNKGVKIAKKDMKKVDNDNYIAMITQDMAQMIGRGSVMLRLTAYIPDGDFKDGLRTEITEVCTGITIS